MAGELLCSTGAFIGRVNGRDDKLIPQMAPRLHCDGLELMLCDHWRGETLERVTERLLAAPGLHMPVAHLPKALGDEISRNAPQEAEDVLAWFAQCCAAAKALGVRKLVLHLWSGAASDGDMPRILCCYDVLFEEAQRRGLSLTVENVPCVYGDPLAHWRALLARNPRAAFTLDIRFAVFQNELQALCGEEALWNGAVRHVHISEYAGGREPRRFDRLRPILHPGEGETDFAGFFSALRARRYAGSITLESPAMSETGIDTALLNRSLDFLRKEME